MKVKNLISDFIPIKDEIKNRRKVLKTLDVKKTR